MNLNDAYTSYKLYPNSDSLTVLFTACRVYASNLTCTCGTDGADLASTAVAKAWQSLDTFKGRSKFSTWFHRIVTNHVSDFYRHKAAAEPVSVFQLMYNDDNQIAFDDAPEHPNRDVRQLPLSDEQRELVATLASTGDYQETASQLGITMKSLYRRLDTVKHTMGKSAYTFTSNHNRQE